MQEQTNKVKQNYTISQAIIITRAEYQIQTKEATIYTIYTNTNARIETILIVYGNYPQPHTTKVGQNVVMKTKGR